MVGKNLIEGLIGPDRFVAVAAASHEAGIGIDKTQRVLVGGVGRFHALQGFLRIIGDIGDERGMIIPENPEIFAVKLVDEGERAARVCRCPHRSKRSSSVAVISRCWPAPPLVK